MGFLLEFTANWSTQHALSAPALRPALLATNTMTSSSEIHVQEVLNNLNNLNNLVSAVALLFLLFAFCADKRKYGKRSGEYKLMISIFTNIC